MQAKFFAKQEDFRQWLEENHASETELLVGFYKIETKKPSLTWSQSVDQALCFGWIDGVRRSIDSESYSIRFTPRRATSIWSTVNINKVAELTQKGLMREAGFVAFTKRQESKSNIYAYEKEPAVLDEVFENRFQENKKAWQFFQSQAPSYKKVMIHWVISAKQDATKISRLEKLINASEVEKRVL
jgi:uncharacterized protein YdeI (YjbR/CyaY-like superfamily)